MACREVTDAALARYIARLFPGEDIVAMTPMAPDASPSGASAKAEGYGEPVKLVLADGRGHRRALVWRTAAANDLGHDRHADRVAEILQADADFARIPRHVPALDVGMIADGGELVSLRGAGEAFLLTSYAPGAVYAGDLRRIAGTGEATPGDLARCEALATYLAALHVPTAGGATAYRRAIRDLIGHGEGIFGVVDSYPDGVPGAPRERLHAIEERCVAYRWRLHDRHDRLARTHGDFHPFNVVFDTDTDFHVLDASRGTCGDPADDLTAMAINFLLFAVDVPRAWPHGLGALWRRWWAAYFGARDDEELLTAAPPFFAWRTLVVCNPRFYPGLSARGRDRLLGLAEDVLDEDRLEPQWGEELFP